LTAGSTSTSTKNGSRPTQLDDPALSVVDA
jgi:hypothetical protein